MWSLTRTPGDSAINHILRLEHYKGQGRQPLDSRSELIKRETEKIWPTELDKTFPKDSREIWERIFVYI